jgi:hypothetical protein
MSELLRPALSLNSFSSFKNFAGNFFDWVTLLLSIKAFKRGSFLFFILAGLINCPREKRLGKALANLPIHRDQVCSPAMAAFDGPPNLEKSASWALGRLGAMLFG